MRYRRLLLLLITLVIIIVFVIIINNKILQTQTTNHELESHNSAKKFVIACVACGQVTLTMIKSALLFNQPNEFIHFIIFTEDRLMPVFREKLIDWQTILPTTFDFEILPLQFPKNSEKEWRTLFKPCSSFRLFLPSTLKSTDALLYVDTDTLFLSPVSDVWRHFERFNATQMAALTPEHEDENAGWYNRFARHPYYGRLGVNSGVMLMNLTRMRDFGWEARVQPIYNEYKLRITWGDQDIINILFYYHPEKLFVMPCQYNYRPDHCMYMSGVCNVTEGIKIIHGNRGYFHSKKQLLFHVVYEAVENYQIGSSPYSNFLMPLISALDHPEVSKTNCGEVSKNTIKIARELFHYDYN